MTDDVPFVAIGEGEEAPWANLDLSCPDCGGNPLPLEDSNPPGLSFIHCPMCDGTWLRGKPNFKRMFQR